ncbi:MAG TPA: hypothetical protein VFR80_01605 [Pyrinomonadaceae bacterium]|nr:hypothetical protein [Pyrinomonadaceae bacterium]
MNGKFGEEVGSLFLKMVYHRLVLRRAIAIVCSVHFPRLVGMFKLDQPARTKALNQLQRPAGDSIVAGARENPGERLIAKLKYRNQFSISAKSALGN